MSTENPHPRRAAPTAIPVAGALRREKGAARPAHVFALALVAGLLVLGGPAAQDPSDAASVAEASSGSPGLDAAAIARKLGQVNPELSASELQRIGAAVMRYSEKYALDPTLVTAVLLVESSARPWARSPKGALGLMQVMPYMMRPMGLVGSPTTIETNVEAGCLILAENIARLGEEDGISAYFWGSDIRSVSYLNRVRSAREKVRSELES
jgi:soluble lytic murein transglycosylase-like protein